MNIIDKLKYKYFYKKFNNLSKQFPSNEIETKNFTIKNNIIIPKNKNLKYFLFNNYFIVCIDDNIIPLELLKFDNLFWDVLEELNEHLKLNRKEMNELCHK